MPVFSAAELHAAVSRTHAEHCSSLVDRGYCGLGDAMTFIHAPITHLVEETDCKSYKLDALKVSQFDFALIDGPRSQSAGVYRDLRHCSGAIEI